MSLRWYEHLGLGLAGLATALSLNVIYPTKKAVFVEARKVIQELNAEYSYRLSKYFELSRDCQNNIFLMSSQPIEDDEESGIKQRGSPSNVNLGFLRTPAELVSSVLFSYALFCQSNNITYSKKEAEEILKKEIYTYAKAAMDSLNQMNEVCGREQLEELIMDIEKGKLAW